MFFLAGLLTADSAIGQLPQIRLNSIFPTGAQVGSAIPLSITGSTDADEATELLFSHLGIRAIARKDAAGSVVANLFDVTVDDSVEPGFYDVRLRGVFGISNPRLFRIDTLPEIAETEPNNSLDTPQQVSLNQIVNGRSNAQGDVDVYQVAVTAGQTVVLRTEAARIDSLMQPVIEVWSQNDRRLEKSRRVLDREAATVVTSDRDQTLTVRIHDLVYGGGDAYVYRLCVDTRPLIDFCWPPVVPGGAESSLILFGRYLPGGQPANLQIDGIPLQQSARTIPAFAEEGPSLGSLPAASVIGTQWWDVSQGNLMRLAVCRGGIPVYRDSDPIVREGSRLTGGFTVAGRLPPRGTDFVVRFFAKKEDVREIEVFAQRLGVPADPMLVVERVEWAADGTETIHHLATEVNGRQNPGGGQLPTFTTDPAFRLTAPADSLYQLRIQDRYAGETLDPRQICVVDVRVPRLDFDLIAFESIASTDGLAPVTAGAVSIRRGGHYEVPVYAFRKGGHNEAITLTIQDPPEGVAALPAVIPPGKGSTKLLLAANDDAPEAVVDIRITGTAGSIRRDAHVATLLHAGVNGLPRTARLTDALLLNVMKDIQPFTITLGVVNADLHQDQQLLVPVHLKRRNGFNGKVDVAFNGQPKNVDVSTVSFAPDVTSATARLLFKENAGVGPAQLLAYGTSTVSYRRNPWKAERAHQRVAEIQRRIDKQQQLVSDAEAIVESVSAEVTSTTKSIVALRQQLEVRMAEIETLNDQLATAADAQVSAIAALQEIQHRQFVAFSEADSVKSRLETIEAASLALETAASDLARLSFEISSRTQRLQSAIQLATEHQTQTDAVGSELNELQTKLKAAQAAVTAAQQQQEQLNRDRTQAAETAKADDEVTQAKDVSVRSVSTPVQLYVYATPGKLTAGVPGGGVIRRGASVDVTVTIARKNGFAGPATVTLLVPDGTGLSATTAAIQADQTQDTVTITAADDAPVAEITSAVLRATTEFKGRSASFDAPVALKVTE